MFEQQLCSPCILFKKTLTQFKKELLVIFIKDNLLFHFFSHCYPKKY